MGLEIKVPDQLLRQTAARTFCNYRGARVHLSTGRVVGAGLAVLLHPHVAELHALDGAVRIQQRRGGRKAREHIDP